MKKVCNVFKKLTLDPIVAHKNEEISSIHHKMLRQKKPSIRSVYVVNEEKKVIGIITLKEIMKIVAIRKALPISKRLSVKTLFEYISKDLTAEMIMRPSIAISENVSIEDALKTMIDHDLEEAAVINEDGIIVGDLSAHEILKEIEI